MWINFKPMRAHHSASARHCSPPQPLGFAVILATLAMLAGAQAGAAIPAFPGAEGYGAYATGGRGGDVYHVTNLNSSGSGSFADAIATVPASGRTIVFDVSGYIHLPGGGNLRLTKDKVTIAGQTAPGDGIGFKDGTFRISGGDVVVRHARFRFRDQAAGGDSIDLDGGCTNAALDHLSIQFGTDENMSSFSSAPENLTLQYSLNAWGLESHSCGGLWDQKHATSHHNLWAHNHTRNPKSRPSGLLEWINNVTYDWDIGFIMGDSQSNQNWKANVINNYFVCPPGNTRSKALQKGTIGDNGKPNFTVFLSGNLIDADGNGLLDGVDNGYGIVEGTGYTPGTSGLSPGAKGYYESPSAITGSTAGVETDSPLLAYKKIVSSAGALRLDSSYEGGIRDEVDTILFSKLASQSRAHVSKESSTGASNGGIGTLESDLPLADTDRDGTPDLYEKAVGMDPAADDHNTAFSSGAISSGSTFFPVATPTGYTYLEEYLHFKASPHTFTARNTVAGPSFVDIDLSRYTGGFVNAPVTFVTANEANGSTVLQADGHTVRFTPTLDFSGRAHFDFTVTDSDGSWTQRFLVLVTTAGLPKNLKWQGDGSANAWDTSTSNWLGNGTPTTYTDADTTTFDDTGSNASFIDIPSSVQPGAITVNADQDYTFGGAGSIAGNTGILKSGAGTLTLNNANTYSGGTTIAGGTLALGNSYSLGTGPISMTNSTLAYSGGTTISIGNTLQLSGECTFAAGATTVNLNPPISGTDASITLDTVTGTTFTLQSDMSGFSGTLNLSVGKLRLYANATNFTYTTVNIGDGSLYSHISSAKAIPFGSISGNLASTLRGSDAGSGTDTYTIGSLNQDSLFEGQILDGTKHTLAITKAGTGTLTLGGESGYTGATKVNAGTLLLSGSLGNTEVTVADGATLAGAGTIGSSTGGAVTASNGATISPGNSQGEAGTLKLGNGLTLEAATLVFDLSDDPTGANNDKITLNGGTLTFVATPTFDFNFLDGTLGNGTYTLISGGTDSSGAFPPASNLPSGTRQTFNLGTPANGAIELVVGGTIPASLIWEGTGGGTWDTQTTSAWSSGPTPTFFNFDSVTFDDTGSTGQVLVGSAVEPRSITADNTSTSYSFSGPGVIGGACKLLKTGEGILSISPAYISLASMTTTGSPDVVVATTAGLAAGMTVSGTGIASGTTIAGVTNGTQFTLSQNATASGNASLSYVPRNNYSGGTFINGGSIVLGNDVANAYGLGTGPVTFNGGTLTMYQSSGFAPSGVSNHFIQDLVVPAGQAGTLNADPRCDYDGKLTGSGTLNFRVASNRTNLFGDWSAFSGILNITTASSGEFRMATDYDYPGFPLASINLAGNVKLLYTGKLHSNAGTIIGIGELTGDALSSFRGTDQGGVLTYRIGGRTAYGDEAVFDGTIYEASSDSITSFEKTGAGTWTLGGPCSWNGGSTIEQGTLKISGTVTSAGAVQVNPGATLSLANGTLTTDTVNIAEGASLSGFGTINADLTNDSIVTFASGGQLTISGEVVNNGTMRLTGGTSLNATGPFVNNGVLDLLTASGPLPALLENNGVVILAGDTDVSSYEMTGNSFTLTLLSYSGHVYQLQRATSLAAPTQWEDIGQPQSGVSQSDGTPTPLIFTDEAPPVSRAFYRIEVIL